MDLTIKAVERRPWPLWKPAGELRCRCGLSIGWRQIGCWRYPNAITQLMLNVGATCIIVRYSQNTIWIRRFGGLKFWPSPNGCEKASGLKVLGGMSFGSGGHVAATFSLPLQAMEGDILRPFQLSVSFGNPLWPLLQGKKVRENPERTWFVLYRL